MPGEVLEWWPEYGGGLLWPEDGTTVSLESLPLRQDLRNRLRAWLSTYDDERLRLEGDGDGAWLQAGRELLRELRAALDDRYSVTIDEPWWE